MDKHFHPTLLMGSFDTRAKFITDCVKYAHAGQSKKKNKVRVANPMLRTRIDCSDIRVNSYLTMQEYHVMSFLMKNYKYREIAAELNLSCRTVEFYINNIKQRFHCKKKKELIQLFANTSFNRYK